ncbi:hypothetical protein Moror_3275 [Moniliophthora roreri MCA 2997]|uniref:Uncharacterized protein n=2 Tax=Moniliophthora roreri TaxID=221103 RepID=V2WRT0_MONRO|nr:hypothetical protein Moror_3275 [Moniliophthora roreri MCA 2997]
MFPVIIHIAVSLVLVKAFKIDEVNPSTISPTNPTLLIKWTGADGDNLRDLPIRLLLVSSEQPSDSTQWVEGYPLIDETTSPNFRVAFAAIPSQGQFLLQAVREEDHWEALRIPPVSIAVTDTPGPITPIMSSLVTPLSASLASPSNTDLTLSSITAPSTSESTPSSTQITPTHSISIPTHFISSTPSTNTFATTPSTTSSTATSPTASAPSNSPQSGPKTMAGIIVGSTLGGLAAILFVGVSFLIYCRRRTKRRPTYEELILSPYPETHKTTPSAQRKIHNREEVGDIVRQQSSTHLEEHDARIPGPLNLQPEGGSQDELPDHQGRLRVLYHDDSGWRPSRRRSNSHGGANGSILEMPPQYDAAL